MDASFSATIDDSANRQIVEDSTSPGAHEIGESRPESGLEQSPSRGGRLATAGLASRLRDLAAVALLAIAALSPARAEPWQGPADTVAVQTDQ